MAINKKLIHFLRLADFETRLANNEILDTSICFIKDAKKIWTHGKFYDGGEANVLAVDTTDEIEDVETNTYVKYVAQILTENLKAQARENIGVSDLSEYAKKTELNNKQDTISDLDTIRNGASAGATALQSVPSEYVTETELAEAIASAITNTLNTAV